MALAARYKKMIGAILLFNVIAIPVYVTRKMLEGRVVSLVAVGGGDLHGLHQQQVREMSQINHNSDVTSTDPHRHAGMTGDLKPTAGYVNGTSTRATQAPPVKKPHRPIAQQKSDCLALAPKEYIIRKPREFTPQELNVTHYAGAEPLIPRIIHQQWNTYDIPAPSVPYVKSIVDLHPDWQYWFWTTQDRECYMTKYHPELLELFHQYPHTIFRTNLMRYFLLYDYGGFYIDLDVRALKPLDVWTHIGSSVLSHETYEHTFFGHLRPQPNVMNTVMATRARHPYYKLLQEHLPEYHKICPDLNLFSNGPFYIDNMYQLYLRSHPNVTERDDVTAIHAR